MYNILNNYKHQEKIGNIPLFFVYLCRLQLKSYSEFIVFCNVTVRVLLCVICSCLLCPYLVCFMLLWVHLCPAVCMWLCVNYPVYISPVFWVWFGLVYLWLPGVSCLSALSCPALMSWLKTIIWVYVLVCVSLFLPRVCTVTEDQTQP